MKDRTFVVHYDQRMYIFSTDKTWEMLNFIITKMGCPFTEESKVKARKMLEAPETWLSLSDVDQPRTTLVGTNLRCAVIWLARDGLETAKVL